MSNVTVYTGFWINHDRDPALGATLTIPIQYANYLIAFLSLLIAWASGSAWMIAAYLIHQKHASKRNKDVLDHQLQVLLRSSNGTFNTLVDILLLQRAWLNKADKVFRRTLPIIVTVVSFATLFALAGVFVADVASKSYEDVIVLAVPEQCGDSLRSQMDAVYIEGTNFTRASSEYSRIIWRASRNYANSWYGREVLSLPPSSPFLDRAMPYNSTEIPCPFQEPNVTRCLGPNFIDGPALEMDTGHLCSYKHFGINAPRQNRITWRKKTTCAVVDTTNLTQSQEEIGDTFQYNMTVLFLGLDTNKSVSTFAWEYDPLWGMYGQYRLGMSPYDLNRPMTYYQNINQGKQDPIKPFYRPDADTSFYFVAPDASAGDIPDPLLSAAQNFSLMVCLDQMQICNPNTGKCSKLSGYWDLDEWVYSRGFDGNEAQTATAFRFLDSTLFGGKFNLNGNFGAQAIQASKLPMDLPPNQWQLEVRLWFETTMVNVQTLTLGWASKPWVASANTPSASDAAIIAAINTTALTSTYEALGLTKEHDTMCRNQLIRSSARVQNFSIIETGLVIGCSLLVITVGSLLPGCMTYGWKRRSRRVRVRERELGWEADEKFQLLRMALAMAEIRDWEPGKGGIPITTGRRVVPVPFSEGGLPGYYASAPKSGKSLNGSSERLYGDFGKEEMLRQMPPKQI